MLSLELFPPGLESSAFCLQAVFQLQSVSGEEMHRKEVSYNLQEIDDCNHDLYLLRAPFQQSILPPPSPNYLDVHTWPAPDQSIMKRLLQVLALWVIIAMLTCFDRAVF